MFEQYIGLLFKRDSEVILSRLESLRDDFLY